MPAAAVVAVVHAGRCMVSGLQGRGGAIPKWEICSSELRLAFFLNVHPN